MPDVLNALVAFVAENQRCGDLDGGRVSELLAGTNAGTSALPERPGASTSVAGDAVEMPRKSRNVRERRGASATAPQELRASPTRGPGAAPPPAAARSP